ncbi:putative metal-dependent hydrolase of the TIM-barrel fold protein (plasmid) [Marinovum algicola DG 898]|nr:putative metal-dependent hydrolase of the TIM-barrel fold protein [Marinovum algicola DG 898]
MIQFDCHAHVYETVTAIDSARYMPARPAPLADWLAHQERHGLQGGVIVQVSFLGTDNSEMCAALAGLDRARFAGVGVVSLDVNDDDLDRLVRAGMRGVRWNLVRGAPVPDFDAISTKRFLARLRDRDLHLEIHLEGPRLAPLLPVLTDQGINLVVDHFGLPCEPEPGTDPMIRAVADLPDRSALHFKFAAHYRTTFDITPHASELLSLLPDNHVVWGSDWPHTQHEDRTGYSGVWSLSKQWRRLSDGAAARRLYRIG